MRYFIRIQYRCDTANQINSIQEGEGRWLLVESDKEPTLGVVNPEPFASGPLPTHGCKRHYYSDSCDMDSSCNWQEILEVRPFSRERADQMRLEEAVKLEV